MCSWLPVSCPTSNAGITRGWIDWWWTSACVAEGKVVAYSSHAIEGRDWLFRSHFHVTRGVSITLSLSFAPSFTLSFVCTFFHSPSVFRVLLHSLSFSFVLFHSHYLLCFLSFSLSLSCAFLLLCLLSICFVLSFFSLFCFVFLSAFLLFSLLSLIPRKKKTSVEIFIL